MKKLLTICIVLSSFVLVSAQAVNSGAWMIGGSAGFNSNKVKDADDATTTITLNPNIGYYFMDNLGVGLNLNITNESFGDDKSNVFGIGPWVRYYVYSSLFAQVGFNYASTKVESGANEIKGTGTQIPIAIGYSWFLNNSVAIEPALYYSINSFEFDGASTKNEDSDFGLSIGIQAFIGRDGE